MRRIIALFIVSLLCFAVYAQAEKSIIIDQQSFRPIQSDALTGVAIDNIGVDSSRRPCARIKMKVERMTREEIGELEIKIVTNNECRKCRVAEYENGLIIEMTAKPETRFYLHHPRLGSSNEVILNLEGNKEYYIAASLNQTYSIVVTTNVVDVNVFIDGECKGQVGSSNSLTIKDVLAGEHTLTTEYGGLSNSQQITVNSGSISFYQKVNTEVLNPQYVVFDVVPTTAVVTIDNKHYPLENGSMMVVLNSGVHNYTVSATGYHPQSGTFTVAGEKVENKIVLRGDNAVVTLTAPDNAEIWVNNSQKGIGRWSGTLPSGTYIFEARKAGYRSSSISKEIVSSTVQQSYELPAPTPIMGSISVVSTPLMADVVLDGKSVGRTPLDLKGIVVGTHTLKISKSGYNDHIQTVTVTEDKVATVSVSLKQKSTIAAQPKSVTMTPKAPKTPKVQAPKPQKSQNYYASTVKRNNSKSYQNIIDLSYVPYLQTIDVTNRISLSYVGGLRMGNIFVGLGLGAELAFENIDNSTQIANAYENYTTDNYGGTLMSSSLFNVPIYAHFRAYMGRRSRTFFSLSAGGKLFGSGHFTYNSNSLNGSNGSTSITIGGSGSSGTRAAVGYSTGQTMSFKYNTNGLSADLGFGLQLGKFYASIAIATQTAPCAEFVSTKQIDLKPKFCFGAKTSIGFNF